MDIAASLIKLFFGSKADKDRKEVEPYLVKIKAVYPTIEALSNAKLRAHSSNLKKTRSPTSSLRTKPVSSS